MTGLERRLEAIGRELEYPRAPDIAGAVIERVRVQPVRRLPARRTVTVAIATSSPRAVRPRCPPMQARRAPLGGTRRADGMPGDYQTSMRVWVSLA